jgi:hypothetical protein
MFVLANRWHGWENFTALGSELKRMVELQYYLFLRTEVEWFNQVYVDS